MFLVLTVKVMSMKIHMLHFSTCNRIFSNLYHTLIIIKKYTHCVDWKTNPSQELSNPYHMCVKIKYTMIFNFYGQKIDHLFLLAWPDQLSRGKSKHIAKSRLHVIIFPYPIYVRIFFVLLYWSLNYFKINVYVQSRLCFCLIRGFNLKVNL